MVEGGRGGPVGAASETSEAVSDMARFDFIRLIPPSGASAKEAERGAGPLGNVGRESWLGEGVADGARDEPGSGRAG